MKKAVPLIRIALGLFVAGLVGACDDTLVNPRVPPPGSSPAFSDGWVDGCLSGFDDAGREGYEHSSVKNEARFTTDPEYRGGFQKAYAACFEEEKLHPRLLSGHEHATPN